MGDLSYKDWRWIFIGIFALVMTNGAVYTKEIDPFREATIPFLLINFLVAVIVGHLQLFIVELAWKKSTSFLRKTYNFLHRSVENSTWVNRALYGPNWREEVE
jgi:hypothetical protein